MLLVDSHCHLNFPDFAEDLPDVIARAEQAGVRVMQTICTHMGEAAEVRAIAEAHPNIYASVGVHPNHVHEAPLVEIAELEEAARHEKVIGIGETGLDYYRGAEHAAAQKESFRRHIAVARTLQLPAIVHTRDAEEDTLAVLAEEMEKGAFPALIHCFGASREFGEACVALGLHISLSGIVTFKSAQALRDTVAALPLDRLLVETDAPYLAPMPYRGKRNEPSYTMFTNKMIAEIKAVSEEESARQTTENFFRLFRKAQRPS